MAFWIFMLVMDIWIPITMIVLGKRFMKKPPKEINMISGYRTTRSMKNQDTWRFAHQYVGKIWFVTGWMLLPASIIVMLFVIGKSTDTVGYVGALVCGAQLIPLLGSIVPTERALKMTFDENGNRKKDHKEE